MMIAIETKYIGPTNFHGSRIKAYTCNGHNLTVDYADNLNSEQNHIAAALQLQQKMNWPYELYTGATKTGYCHVQGKQIRPYKEVK